MLAKIRYSITKRGLYLIHDTAVCLDRICSGIGRLCLLRNCFLAGLVSLGDGSRDRCSGTRRIWTLLRALSRAYLLRAAMMIQSVGDEEQVLLIVRRHWASLLHDILYVVPPILATLALLLLVSAVPQSGAGVGIHVLAALLLPLSLLAVFTMAAILWSNYYLGMIVVTDRRLFFISQTSLTKRDVLGWNLHEVRNIEAMQNTFLETFFNFGTLQVRTSGEEQPAFLEGIPDPEYVSQIILKQDEQFGHLRETTQKQKELLKFLSHEVKGHLTKSKAAFASIVEGDYGPMPAPLVGMAQTALEDSQRGVETVMSILDNANVESGEMQITLKPFDLAESVRKLVEEFRANAAMKGLGLVSSVEDACVINGDQEKIARHVLRNLLDNAIRYTRAGQVDVMLEKASGMARISVSDSGVGISEFDMQKLFTQGGHGEHSREINPESTGYGLFVAKQIVEKHGGRIWARSAGEEKGSTFFVEFPLLRQ